MWVQFNELLGGKPSSYMKCSSMCDVDYLIENLKKIEAVKILEIRQIFELGARKNILWDWYTAVHSHSDNEKLKTDAISILKFQKPVDQRQFHHHPVLP